MPLFGRDARDELIETLRTELCGAHKRETALLAQISDLVNKLSAHSDLRAHAAAARRDEPRPERRIPEVRVPAHAQGLIASGQLDIAKIRSVQRAFKPKGLPPVVKE